jgi:hypothetical protein
MSNYRRFMILREPPRAAGKVVPLRMARVRTVTPPPSGPVPPPSRETSWRDLVRRLAKRLAKR